MGLACNLLKIITFIQNSLKVYSKYPYSPLGIIYVLKCPNTLLVRYVGVTFDICKRTSSHLYPKRLEKTRKDGWVWGLITKQKKRPIIEWIDTCNRLNAQKKEKDYIKLYKSVGANLLNMTNGGEVCKEQWFLDKEAKRKIKEKHTKERYTKERSLKMSARLRQRWQNPIYRECMKNTSISNLKKITFEQIEKRKIAARKTFTKNKKMNFCKYIKILNKKKEMNNARFAEILPLFDVSDSTFYFYKKHVLCHTQTFRR